MCECHRWGRPSQLRVRGSKARRAVADRAEPLCGWEKLISSPASRDPVWEQREYDGRDPKGTDLLSEWELEQTTSQYRAAKQRGSARAAAVFALEVLELRAGTSLWRRGHADYGDDLLA